MICGGKASSSDSNVSSPNIVDDAEERMEVIESYKDIPLQLHVNKKPAERKRQQLYPLHVLIFRCTYYVYRSVARITYYIYTRPLHDHVNFKKTLKEYHNFMSLGTQW